jgi:ferredoxin
MARRIFPEVPRVCLQCGAAWLQGDGKAPRDYCTTSCRNEADRQAHGKQTPEVDAPTDRPVRTYLRRVRAKAYTSTCAWCGAAADVEQYPGPPPRYCSPECRTEAAREGAAARMRRMRARRQQAPSVTSTQIS